MFWKKLLSAACLAMTVSLVGFTGAFAESSPLTIITPGSAVDQTGRSYSTWSALWWQTMLRLPNSLSPVTDPTGAQCARGEGSSFFFLAGSSSPSATVRSCTVPSSKLLFLPIINTECSSVEAAPFFGATASERATCAAVIVNTAADLKVVLDNVVVAKPQRLRAASPPFGFTMPATENFLGVTGVTSGQSASDGYWLLLRRPSVGQHVIHVEGAFLSAVAGFSQDVTYNLTVVRGDDAD